MIKYLLCTAGGVAIGYFIAQQRLEDYYNERADRAEDEAKDFYRRQYEAKAKADGEDPEFTKAAIKAAEALQNYKGISMGPSVLTEELTESFRREEEDRAVEADDIDEGPEEGDSEEDPDPVKKIEALTNPVVKAKMMETIVPEQKTEPVNYNRVSTPEKAMTTAEKEAVYIPDTIKAGDYINNVSGLDQSTVTYFAGDDILANSNDEIISEEARLMAMGREFQELLKAGPEAMGGDTTLYIRNTNLGREFEIIWSSGSYEDEVGDPIYASG
jgi:hypothetical protein